ncbi:hypothetical protein AMJ80_12590 [bacterium SM23_31]|nr:MAG: hypothetical protein AMJ80_12590 [bacterium SM23_31]
MNKNIINVHNEYKNAENKFLNSDWDGTIISIRKSYEKLLNCFKKIYIDEKGFRAKIKTFSKEILEPEIGETKANMISQMMISQIDLLNSVAHSSHPINRSTASLTLKEASIIFSYIIDSIEPKH